MGMRPALGTKHISFLPHLFLCGFPILIAALIPTFMSLFKLKTSNWGFIFIKRLDIGWRSIYKHGYPSFPQIVSLVSFSLSPSHDVGLSRIKGCLWRLNGRRWNAIEIPVPNRTRTRLKNQLKRSICPEWSRSISWVADSYWYGTSTECVHQFVIGFEQDDLKFVKNCHLFFSYFTVLTLWITFIMAVSILMQ